MASDPYSTIASGKQMRIRLKLRPTNTGYAKCPVCGWRFKVTDVKAFSQGVHLHCGARLKIVDAS